MLKFATGDTVFVDLSRQTSSAGDELAAHVRALGVAAEPIANDFQGAGRVAFDNFHRDVDQIAADLSRALTSMLTGINAQGTAFAEGGQQIADDTRAAHAGVSYDSGRFGSSR